MNHKTLKKTCVRFGINPIEWRDKCMVWSISHAVKEQGLEDMVLKLRQIEPDITGQERGEYEYQQKEEKLWRRVCKR